MHWVKQFPQTFYGNKTSVKCSYKLNVKEILVAVVYLEELFSSSLLSGGAPQWELAKQDHAQ